MIYALMTCSPSSTPLSRSTQIADNMKKYGAILPCRPTAEYPRYVIITSVPLPGSLVIPLKVEAAHERTKTRCVTEVMTDKHPYPLEG